MYSECVPLFTLTVSFYCNQYFIPIHFTGHEWLNSLGVQSKSNGLEEKGFGYTLVCRKLVYVMHCSMHVRSPLLNDHVIEILFFKKEE